MFRVVVLQEASQGHVSQQLMVGISLLVSFCLGATATQRLPCSREPGAALACAYPRAYPT